jgi:hypothetical protein
MSIHYQFERLQEENCELESTIEDLAFQVEEHKEDVIFLYGKMEEVLFTLEEDDLMGFPKAKKILREALYGYEYKAIEELRKEELN